MRGDGRAVRQRQVLFIRPVTGGGGLLRKGGARRGRVVGPAIFYYMRHCYYE